MEDIFVPQSSADGALTGPLHTVTWITGDKAGLERAMVDGYGLSTDGWQAPEPSEKASLAAYFDLEPEMDFEIALFQRKGAAANVQLRAISVSAETPCVRPVHEGLYLGGATVSFPIQDLHAHNRHMASIGVETTIGVKEMDFTSPTGEVYTSAEIAYLGPDNIFMLGVTRPNIFVPVGPVDEAAGIGGMAYSARCTEATNAIMALLEDVLGWELRRDIELTVGPRSAINMPEGTVERFIQAFAPGTASGYLVLMDHGAATKRNQDVPLGPPGRGIVMWSFPADDLDAVAARAKEKGADIVFGPADVASPGLPSKRAMVLRDADGFPIEVFQA